MTDDEVTVGLQTSTPKPTPTKHKSSSPNCARSSFCLFFGALLSQG
jgi:hypothetical protein